MRMVSPGAFAGARRMHGGGIAGDEEAIIAKKGEVVAWPSQIAAMGDGGINITQHFHNDFSAGINGTDQAALNVQMRTIAAAARDEAISASAALPQRHFRPH
jgi:hypothetical protein